MIKIYIPEEPLEVDPCHRSRHGRDGCHFRSQGHNASGAHCVAQESDGVLAENSLFPVDRKPGAAETFEELTNMGSMRRQAWTGDQNVVQVDENELQVLKLSLIHI